MSDQAQGHYPGPQQYPAYPYPQFPQYPGGPYPGGPYQGGYAPPPRPPMPPSVRQSFYAMIVGAAATVIGSLLIFTQADTLRADLRDALPQESASTLNTFVNVTLVMVVVVALIEGGLWVWMAIKVRSGRHWARVLSSVFFGIGAVSALVGGFHVSASDTGQNGVTHTANTTSSVESASGWITLVIGLVAIVLMWQRSNSGYFHPERAGGYPPPGFGYPGAPGPGWPMQQPPMQAQPGQVPPQQYPTQAQAPQPPHVPSQQPAAQAPQPTQEQQPGQAPGQPQTSQEPESVSDDVRDEPPADEWGAPPQF